MRRGKLYLGCLVGLGLLYGLPVRLGMVLGDSMAPTYHNGQFYLLDRGYYHRNAPQRNDVIVFKRNGVRYVKRIAAAPGDLIYVNRNQDMGKDELVFAREVERLKSIARKWPQFRAMKPIARRVPSGYCYVLGDHLANSEDSRMLGFIPVEEIEGRVIAPAPEGSVLRQLAVVPGPRSL